MNKIMLSRGDHVQIEAVFTDENGDAVDITGATVYFTVKKKSYYTDAQAEIQKTVTTFDDPTSGIAYIELSPTDTDIEAGLYMFDIQIKESDGTITSTYTGRIHVRRDITIIS